MRRRLIIFFATTFAITWGLAAIILFWGRAAAAFGEAR